VCLAGTPVEDAAVNHTLRRRRRSPEEPPLFWLRRPPSGIPRSSASIEPSPAVNRALGWAPEPPPFPRARQCTSRQHAWLVEDDAQRPSILTWSNGRMRPWPRHFYRWARPRDLNPWRSRAPGLQLGRIWPSPAAPALFLFLLFFLLTCQKISA
jgi:hypothetical protein